MTFLATQFSKTERTYHGPELRPHFLLTEMGLRGSALGAFIGPCEVKTEHLVDWEDRMAADHIQAKWMVHFIGEFFGMGLREGVVVQRLLMATMGELLNEHLQKAHFQRANLPKAGLTLGPVWRSGDDLFVGGMRGADDLPVVGSAAGQDNEQARGAVFAQSFAESQAIRSLDPSPHDLDPASEPRPSAAQGSATAAQGSSANPASPDAQPRKLSVSIVTASPVSILLHAGINIDPSGAPVPAIGLQELGVVPDHWVPEVLERFSREWDGIHWACAKVRPVL